MTANTLKFLKNTFKRNAVVQRFIDNNPVLTKNTIVNQYFDRFGVERGDVIIDLGANVGDVSIYFARKGCLVYAYEPNPAAFDKLETRFKGYENVNCIQKAVGNKNESSELYLWAECPENPLINSVGSSLRDDKSDVSSNSITVDVVDIKEIINMFEKIKLVKMDIEGAEYDVLPELLDLSDRVEYVICETHQHLLPGASNKHAMLEEEITKRHLGERWLLDWH